MAYFHCPGWKRWAEWVVRAPDLYHCQAAKSWKSFEDWEYLQNENAENFVVWWNEYSKLADVWIYLALRATLNQAIRLTKLLALFFFLFLKTLKT